MTTLHRFHRSALRTTPLPRPETVLLHPSPGLEELFVLARVAEQKYVCALASEAHDTPGAIGWEPPWRRKRKWSRLTDEQKQEARARYARGGITQKELAEIYGINASTMFKVLQGLRGKTES